MEIKSRLYVSQTACAVLTLTNKYKRIYIMPLVKGAKAKTRAGFSENVKREIEAGKPQKQAVAIAYSEAREGKKKK